MKIFAAVIALAALGLVGYLLYDGSRSQPEMVPPAGLETSGDSPAIPEREPPTVAEAPDQGQLDAAGLGPVPELESSDAYLKDILDHEPGWKTILNTKNLLRKAVTAVDLISRNENPSSQLNFLQPKSAFKATEGSERLLLTADNYARYEPFIAFVNGLDPQKGALLYRHLFPVLNLAYEELGNGDQAFAAKLDQVMQAILDFEPPAGDIELAGKDGSYIFTDEILEAKPSLEKALIRMGPAHTAVLQEKIRAFRQALRAP